MSSSSGPRKRKAPSAWEEDDESGSAAPDTKVARKRSSGGGGKRRKAAEGEKRLRRFRPKAPVSFEVVYQRATEQRFYVLSRTRHGTPDCPEESVEVAGSTGNVYTVRIERAPSCSCPHARAGHQCKHVVYVLARVLRARPDLVYQLALLTSELREIFEHAPPIANSGDSDDNDDKNGSGSGSSSGSGDKRPRDPNRKDVEGDCPICFSPFEHDGAEGEDIVYCRATCGQNMHRECLQMWAATKRQGVAVTCPMCRSAWEEDEESVKKIKDARVPVAGGYVNVASQLGISGIRDTSTYYDGPRRGQSRRGYRHGYGVNRWR
ncbi:putative swim zinc finger protein [Rosellinia necatrix]|uniref:Putative swim zinc finger protein n=1 Tax=Rosellinia necatrix TaxID=77044 RepID=A0A1W2TF67_ROSNE|nr:putative swim zinc finger protein [Rosellinia necatrix]